MEERSAAREEEIPIADQHSLSYCAAQCKRHNCRAALRCPRRRVEAGFSDTDGRSRLKATVKWIDQVSFVAETGSGHAVVVDGSPDAGGRNVGPRPMELVLAGTAACTAFDVVWILKKARQPISGCTVDAEVERAPADPKVFTRMHFVYRIRGEGLNPAQVERAVKLSKEKYCSATLMLAKTAAISYEISINGEPLKPTP